MSNTLITANFELLLNDANETTVYFLRNAVKEIDDLFGKGYAEKHPELVATLVQTASASYGNISTAKILEDGMDKISDAIFSLEATISHSR